MYEHHIKKQLRGFVAFQTLNSIILARNISATLIPGDNKQKLAALFRERAKGERIS
jgi:hypothetical protein